MDCLYHYCSNEKCFSILDSKTLRLSDIQKSNDYREMSLFFPELIYTIEDIYKADPFPFKYKNLNDDDAFFELTRESYNYWRYKFSNGIFSDFVICFSEAVDSLSQWRGYAENGKGCCIGFSKRLLEEYCTKYKNILKFIKVEYISDKEIKDNINTAAKVCLKKIKTLRSWVVDNMTHDDSSPDTDGLLHFNIDGMIESIFVDTLRFKSVAFHDELEWRIFFQKGINKNPEWLLKKDISESPISTLVYETETFLKDRIHFNVSDNDIIPFCTLCFDEFSDNPVIELWTGPKNNIREMDIKLYLSQNGYTKTKPYHSRITYC